LSEYDLISKIKDINEFVESFKKLLSIENNIEIRSSYQAGSTSIVCDCKNNKWILIYYPNDPIFLLIHELGHLYLTQITKCIYFAKQPPSNTDEEIFSYVNSIVDEIVNYKLSRYEEIYPYFVNYIEYVFYRTGNGINIKDLQFPLSFYIEYYLELNFNLNTSELKTLKPRIQRFLDDYEHQLVRDRILDKKDLPPIKNMLENFSDYLENETSTTFIYCIIKILKGLKKWSSGFINKNIKSIFHLK